MALKSMMLRKKLDGKKAELEALRSKDADFTKRESEIETAIKEATTSEEEEVVNGEIEQFEKDKTAHEDSKQRLNEEITQIENELAAEEEKIPAPAPVSEEPEQRGKNMETKTNFFGMSRRERDAFLSNEQVKSFLGTVRTCIKEKRGVANVDVTIPEVMFPLIREKVEKKSKLLPYVNGRRTSGTSRQPILGTIPEAVWTEMCGSINELDLTFNEVELDGYKVAGFVPLCNAVLEDSEEDLAREIIDVLGAAMAKALDKAIVYGKGVKMPLGFVTRLAQTAKPESYPAKAREWKDLHESHVITGTGKSGVALIQEIILNSAVTINEYSDTSLVWVMNTKTHRKIMASSMDKNLNGTLVAGLNKEMPVIGGEIIELPFMADDDIAWGYLDLYALAERGNMQLSTSSHVKFIEDYTVFKGTARYDGKPSIPEAFGIMSIGTTAPKTSIDFATDKANAAS